MTWTKDKLGTELFSRGNVKNMADKDTIDTTPDHDSPNADTLGVASQDADSTDSNFPYS